jgi:hypothetical protein
MNATIYNSITFEAADLDTIKNAAAQWKRNEFRLKGRKITLITINEKKD